MGDVTDEESSVTFDDNDLQQDLSDITTVGYDASYEITLERPSNEIISDISGDAIAASEMVSKALPLEDMSGDFERERAENNNEESLQVTESDPNVFPVDEEFSREMVAVDDKY